jgi:hypothetical protein
MPDFETGNPLEKSNGVADDADEIVRLETEVAIRRERVAASLGELRRRVDGVTNWRRWIGAHPLAFIAVGLSLGFVFGYVGGGPKDRMR